jgi:hypothetical protein
MKEPDKGTVPRCSEGRPPCPGRTTTKRPS